MRFTPRRLCAPFILLFLLLGWVTPHAQAEPFFEFCDDLRKCRCCQAERDPFEERIETERHDFTQSAVTVGRGVVQVESGYSYFYKDAHDEIEVTHATPETMVRLGLTEDIEFRLRWNYGWRFIDDEPDREGSADLVWSLKLQMTRQPHRGLLPTSALEIRSTAPTGGDSWTSGRMEFGLDYIYQWELKEDVTFAGSTGFGTNGLGEFGLLPDEPARDRFVAFSQSAVLGLELTESATMYAEWYGLFSRGLEDEFVISIFNIGVDYYVTDNFVVDYRAGVGLSGDSDDFFTGIGGGLRF